MVAAMAASFWQHLGHRIAPPRFLAFLAISVVGFVIMIGYAGWSRAALIGFDAGAAIFLLSCFPLLGNPISSMREAARINDANRMMLLVITAIVGIIILVAIAVELSHKHGMHPLTILLVIGTLLIAWLFSNLIYALHYAHLYYSASGDSDHGGLSFPGVDEPGYGEFVYFAFTLGMTFQTSDVEISSSRIRRIATLHSFAAFVFNIGVLAFTINVLGGR